MRRFKINGRDEGEPARKKETRREHRSNREFPTSVKERKWTESRGKCESCNKKLKQSEAHYHHIMALAYAFHYFPWIPAESLRAKENCQMICEECHTDIHKNDSLRFYTIMAANFVNSKKKWLR